MSEFTACNRVRGCVGGLLTIMLLAAASTATAKQFDLPFVWRAGDLGTQGFVRIQNLHDGPMRLRMTAYNEDGQMFGPIYVDFSNLFEAKHFNSEDLYYGNSAKGLPNGFGAEGDLRLRLDTPADDQEVFATAFNRTSSGFLTAMLPTVRQYYDGGEDGEGCLVLNGTEHCWGADVPIFNPARNTSQVSFLRLSNPHAQPVSGITLLGRNDAGNFDGCRLPALNGYSVYWFTAEDLEAGCFTDISQVGKWQLILFSDRRLDIHSLLYSRPTNLWTNLSAAAVWPTDRLNSGEVTSLPARSQKLVERVFRRGPQAKPILRPMMNALLP